MSEILFVLFFGVVLFICLVFNALLMEGKPLLTRGPFSSKIGIKRT
jgi:hypothetical protein